MTPLRPSDFSIPTFLSSSSSSLLTPCFFGDGWERKVFFLLLFSFSLQFLLLLFPSFSLVGMLLPCSCLSLWLSFLPSSFPLLLVAARRSSSSSCSSPHILSCILRGVRWCTSFLHRSDFTSSYLSVCVRAYVCMYRKRICLLPAKYPVWLTDWLKALPDP